MAIRDHIRVDVLVRRAAALQEVDAELGEVERILRIEQTGAAGSCGSCGAPHSSGARLLLAVRPARCSSRSRATSIGALARAQPKRPVT